MAKSEIAKLVDLHVEKVVLGVCALLLVFAVAHWGISSPREFKPAAGGTPMEPGQVDKYLVQRGAALAERAANPKPPESPLPGKSGQDDPKWDEVIQGKRLFRAEVISQPSLGEPLYAKVKPAGAAPPPGIPLVEFTKVMPTPPAPRVVSNTVLIRTDKPADACINGGVLAYPFKQLVAKWDDLEHSVVRVPKSVEIEVEETAPDGTKTLKMIEPLIRRPAQPKGDKKDPLTPPAIPDYTPGKNQPAVFAVINEYNTEMRQKWILIPDLPQIWEATLGTWVRGEALLAALLPRELQPVMPSKVEVLPREKVPPGKTTPPAKATPPAGKTPVKVEPGRRATDPGLTRKPKATTPPRALPSGDDGGFRPPRVPPVDRNINLPIAGRDDDGGGFRGGRALPPPDRSINLPTIGGGGRDAGETIAPILQSRRNADKIYLWWLHANVKVGYTYRYHVRVTFISPLLARDAVAKNIEETKIKTVESPWSAWSEPVTVMRPIRFFLVNKVTEGQVRVAVFAHAMGRWVRRDYTVAQGDPIGRMEPQQKVWNPIVDKEQELPVDFTTGMVALDFAETSVVLPGGRSSVGVEMIYMDDDGRLKAATNVMADRSSQGFKEYEAMDLLTRSEPRRVGMAPSKAP